MLLNRKEIISKILIIMFLITYFIPNFYAIDRIGNQWFFLSIVTFLSAIFLIKDSDLYSKIKSTIFEKTSILYLIFIIWSLISISFSYNKVEALVTFNQYFSVFIAFIFMKALLSNISNSIDFILKLFLILLSIEVFMSLYPMLKDIENNMLTFRSMDYKGAAANINISSFSILYKIPILLYFLTKEKNLYKKTFFTILLFSALFIISILGTRGAYIGAIICIISYLVYLFNANFNSTFKIKKLVIVGSTLILVLLANLNLTQAENNIISRTATISFNTQDGSVNQRLRYYKQGLNHFIENPILGVGIGNWKLTSIDYDKKNIDGFTIPYHAHNDFIQLLVELGFFGLLFYTLFIFFSVNNLFYNKFFKDHINFLLLGSLSIYLVDSLLNFPIARPISQLFLITFLCLVSQYEKKAYE